MGEAQASLSRRSFLKTAGATAALAAAGGMASVSSLAPTKVAAEPEERVAYTFHQAHCGCLCSLKCTVRDNRLVLIEPNSCEDGRYETVCVRGLSEIEHIYNPGRVQVPLKRTGERGSGEFTAVSWDEAMDEIMEKLEAVQASYGNGAVWVRTCLEPNFPHLGAMLKATSGGFIGVDNGLANGFDRAGVNNGWFIGQSQSEIRDWVDSKFILSIGNNHLESTVAQSLPFYEALDAGAKIVVVDPQFSTTASRASEWVPIEPGTDGALFLAMTKYIVDNNLADFDFMKTCTVFPFLVNRETGQFARYEEPTAENEQEAQLSDAPIYLVIDESTGEVVSHTKAGITPSLEGHVVYQGSPLCTVYDLMLEQYKPYTLDWASGITGIPSAKIKELAESFADGPSSLALGWGGNDKFSNADIAGHAAVILGAVSGNLGHRKGGSAGMFIAGTYTGYMASLGGWALPAGYVTQTPKVAFYDLPVMENNIHAFITCGDTFAQNMANMNQTIAWVKTLDLIVSIDTYFTEGAKWSDYVLPSTSRFELPDAYGQIRGGYNHIVLQEKILDPLFQSKSDLQIEHEFAKRLGIQNILPKDGEEYVRAVLANSPDPYINSITLETLVEHKGIYPMQGIESPRRDFLGGTYLTPTGKVELYYPDLLEDGQALAMWEAPLEAYAENPLRKEYPFQMCNQRTRFRIHMQFNTAKWINDIFVPALQVNPRDMQTIGIKTDDVVEVYNSRGSFKVKAQANEGVRPGTVRFFEGITSDFVVEGNMQQVTNNTVISRGRKLPSGPVIPFADTLVNVKKAEVQHD